METTLTCINRHDSLRPVGPQATQTLLDEKKIPALHENQYQLLADYLFSANLPLRLQAAETVFRHDKQHPHALGLFLACVLPSAQSIANHLFARTFPPLPDLTEELMYDGAFNGAITMFQKNQLLTNFRSILYLAMKEGAVKTAFGRMENTRIRAFGARKQRPPAPRLDEQLIAKEILEKIAALDPSPETACAYRLLQCILEIGPSDAIRPSNGSGKRSGKHRMIDLKPVMDKLHIGHSAARHYLCQARQMLRQMFNQDGTLFTKKGPAPKTR